MRAGLNGPTEGTEGTLHSLTSSSPRLKLGLPVGAGPPPLSVLVAKGADGGCAHQLSGEKPLESKADTEEIRGERGSEALGASPSTWMQPGLKPNTSGI